MMIDAGFANSGSSSCIRKYGPLTLIAKVRSKAASSHFRPTRTQFGDTGVDEEDVEAAEFATDQIGDVALCFRVGRIGGDCQYTAPEIPGRRYPLSPDSCQ